MEGRKSMSDIPSPKLHPEVAINQHLVPQCYMRQWSYNRNKSVWIFDKNAKLDGEKTDWRIESKKIEKINAKNNFYDIKAGSMYMPYEAAEEIFGPVEGFRFTYNGFHLDSPEKLNQYYEVFDKWEIFDSDGNVVEGSKRDRLKEYFASSRYTYIETAWNRCYENDWRRFITKVENNVRGAVVGNSPPGITQEDLALVIKYAIIFDWRCTGKTEIIDDAVRALFSIAPEIFDGIVPGNKEENEENTTFGEIIYRTLWVKWFYEYLKNDSGVLKQCLNEYLKNISVKFCLTDSTYPFITSDVPSFISKRDDGYVEHVFVARPTLLVVLGRGETSECYASRLSHDEVNKYNRSIAEHGNLLILPQNTFPISDLFEEAN